MIMGHVPFGSDGVGFIKWIHGFHMPLFFVISGYFYTQYSFSSVLKKRIQSLLIPYFVFGTAFLCINWLIQKKIEFGDVGILFFENTAGYGIPLGGALWFLTAAFFADIIYAIIDRIGNSIAVACIIILISLLGMISAALLPLRLPYGLDAALVGVGLIHIGRILRNKLPKVFNLGLFQSLLIAVISSALIMVNGYVNLRTGKYGNWILFWINSVGMTIALWNIARYIDFLMIRFKMSKILNWIHNIGHDSIVFLCVNQFAIYVTAKIIWHFGRNLIGGLNVILLNTVILIFVLIETYIFRNIIIKFRLTKLIGR